jgi:hypothetical protein
MKNRRNYYRILHVQPDAPAEVIRTSYRTMMHRLKMHPDLGGDHWNATVINEAFEVLSDPAKRAAYDKTLKAFGNRQPSGDAATPTPTAENKSPKDQTQAPQAEQKKSRLDACPFCATRYEARIADSADSVCFQCQSPLSPVSKHEGSTATRRALARLPRHMLVTVEVAGRPGVTFEMTTEDLSIHGLRVTTSFELLRGQKLKIKCPFGTAVGVVTHVVAETGKRSGQWDAGVQFLTLQVTENRGVLLSVEG